MTYAFMKVYIHHKVRLDFYAFFNKGLLNLGFFKLINFIQHNIKDFTLTIRLIIHAFLLSIILVTIFIFDTVSRLEIAAAVFYIIVILIGARYFVARGIILLSVVCTVLTISSFLLTKDGAYKEGLINTIIALMALYLTSYIVIRAQMSEKRAMNATEQMTRMARIQSLGELTASIAHEINQPLAATTASADACRNWLVRDKPDIGRAVQALERISKEAHRASEVIERVRRLSKNEITKKEIVDFNEIVAETIALSKALIEHNDIELHWNRCESKLLIDADRVQIMQVIGNLFLNAIEALNIRHAADRFITVKTFILDNRANLRMTDTGIGISDDDLKHIFDAFWTKREGGTGLGLTLCRAIVEAHKGVITARTNPHGGAIFEISLPLAIKPEVILHGQ